MGSVGAMDSSINPSKIPMNHLDLRETSPRDLATSRQVSQIHILVHRDGLQMRGQ